MEQCFVQLRAKVESQYGVREMVSARAACGTPRGLLQKMPRVLGQWIGPDRATAAAAAGLGAACVQEHRVSACPGSRDNCHWVALQPGGARRALLALAEHEGRQQRRGSVPHPSWLSVPLRSQISFEDRRSGRPRSAAWGPDWDRLSHAGDRRVRCWGGTLAALPYPPAIPTPLSSALLPLPGAPHASLPPTQHNAHPASLPGALCRATSWGPSCHATTIAPSLRVDTEQTHHMQPPRLTWTPLSLSHPCPSFWVLPQAPAAELCQGRCWCLAQSGRAWLWPGWCTAQPRSLSPAPAPHQPQSLCSTEAPPTPKPAPRTAESEDRRSERKENRSSTFFGYRRQETRLSVPELPEPKVMVPSTALEPSCLLQAGGGEQGQSWRHAGLKALQTGCWRASCPARGSCAPGPWS